MIQESPFPAHDGKNYTDLTHLLRAGEQSPNVQSSLQEAFRELHLHYRDLDNQSWQEMIYAGEMVSNFQTGKHFVTPSPYTPGRWLPYRVENPGQEERRALSIMQWHLTSQLEKWQTSNPDILVKPGVEDDEAYEAAEGMKLIVSHYERKFYGPTITIQECLQGNCYGSYIWRLKPDPSQPIQTYREMFANREVKIGPGYGTCGDCPHQGSESDFKAIPDEEGGGYQCPKCGGDARVETASQIIPTMTGHEPVSLPDIALSLELLPACRWDLHGTVQDSEWMIIEKRTTMTAIRQLFGNVRIPGNPGSNIGLDVIDRMAYNGQATAGHSNSQGRRPKLFKEPVTTHENWWSPNQYGDIKFTSPVKTVEGGEIPAGVRLGDFFKGARICTLGLNDYSMMPYMGVEDHRDYMSQGAWYSKMGTGAGRGQQDLVEVQKRLNSDDQQLHTFWRATATPAMGILTGILGEESKGRYIGAPNKNVYINRTNLPEGWKVEDAVKPLFQAPQASGQFAEYTYRRLEEYAQKASHALNMTSGLPGVSNSTATGANITQAITDGLFLPPLSIKGEIREDVARKLGKLYPKMFPVDRYFPLGGKYTQQTGKFIAGKDLDMLLVYEVVKDSYLPRNSYLRRQDYTVFGNVMVALSGVPNYLTPDVIGDLEKTFDLSRSDEPRNVARGICFRRVRQMQQLAQMTQDPMALIAQLQPPVVAPSVNPFTGQPELGPSPTFIVEPSHSLKIEWLSDWLDCDQAQESPITLRMAVAQLIQLHFKAEGMKQSAMAAQQGQAGVAGSLPGMIAQHVGEQYSQASQPEQEQQIDPNNQLSVADNEAQRKHDATEAARDRTHEEKITRIATAAKKKTAA